MDGAVALIHCHPRTQLVGDCQIQFKMPAKTTRPIKSKPSMLPATMAFWRTLGISNTQKETRKKGR